MKKILVAATIAGAMLLSNQSFAWGQKGHRITAKIAELNLSPKAKAAIDKILGRESMAKASTWYSYFGADDENANNIYNYSSDPKVITNNIQKIIEELKSSTITAAKAKANIRALIYLLGEVHQPLNLNKEGQEQDSKVKVKWFGHETNLQNVWDFELIDHQKLSYTEYVDFINRPTAAEKKKWMANLTVANWANESLQLHDSAFKISEKDLSYQYSHDHIKEIEQRLLQGGLRLAAILNSIYG